VSEAATAPAGLRPDDPGSSAVQLLRLVRRIDVVAVMPYLYLVGLSVALYLLQSALLTGQGALEVRATAVLPLALIAFGQTLAIYTRGIDLSVGGIVSTTTAIVATHSGVTGFSLALLVAGVIALAAFGGLVNGLVVSLTRLQPFIVTLATWSIWGGIAFVVLPVEGGATPNGLVNGLLGSTFGIPKSVIGVVILFGVWFWLRNTRFVIDLKAIGSDEARARLIGIPLVRRKVQVYVLSASLSALAGIWVAAQTASGAPTAGDQFILNSVAAVVIGGVSIYGGTGSAASSIIGAIVLLMIPDLVFALKLTSFWSVFFQGFLLIVTVMISSLVINYRESRARSL
jgi:ribose transport system permease protein